MVLLLAARGWAEFAAAGMTELPAPAASSKRDGDGDPQNGYLIAVRDADPENPKESIQPRQHEIKVAVIQFYQRSC